MSVGEASYLNYPDSDLARMISDTVEVILPELSSRRQTVPLRLNHSGELVAVGFVRELSGGRGCVLDVDLSGTRVSCLDTTLTAGGQEYAICVRTVGPEDEGYFDLCLRSIQDDALALAQRIKATAQSKAGDVNVYEELSCACADLKSRLQDLNNPEVQNYDSLWSTILNSRRQAGSSSQQESESDCPRDVQARRSRIYDTVRHRMKTLRGTVRDRKKDVRAVISLCEAGVQAVRVGSALSRDVERDFMEVLGSGGFKHWTNKKKDRVTNRALGQVNADSVQQVDTKVAAMLEATVGGGCASSVREVEVGDADDEDIGLSAYDHPTRRRCWLTLMEDEDLTNTGDVLCLMCYVGRGERNLPLCSVSSAKVLHGAVLNRKVAICPQPMSFLTMRELLLEGKEVARGPNSLPLNACLCMLPSSTSPLSGRLAAAYAPLAASQLLTSRWIYTEVSTRNSSSAYIFTNILCCAGGG